MSFDPMPSHFMQCGAHGTQVPLTSSVKEARQVSHVPGVPQFMQFSAHGLHIDSSSFAKFGRQSSHVTGVLLEQRE